MSRCTNGLALLGSLQNGRRELPAILDNKIIFTSSTTLKIWTFYLQGVDEFCAVLRNIHFHLEKSHLTHNLRHDMSGNITNKLLCMQCSQRWNGSTSLCRDSLIRCINVAVFVWCHYFPSCLCLSSMTCCIHSNLISCSLIGSFVNRPTRMYWKCPLHSAYCVQTTRGAFGTWSRAWTSHQLIDFLTG